MTALSALWLASSAPLALTAPPPATETSSAASAPATAPESAVGQPLSYDLTWPQDVHLVVDDSDDAEVVVQYDQPVEEAAIAALGSAAGDRLSDLRWNDMSLVLRPADGTRMRATVAGRALHLEFAPIAAPDAEASAGPDVSRDLALARAQADAAAGYPWRARRQLIALSSDHPDDQSLQRLLADADVASGEIADAALRYRTLKADDIAARRTMAQAGGWVTAGVTVRDSDDFSQTEAGASALIATAGRLQFGAGIRQFDNRTTAIAGPAGPLLNAHSTATLLDAVAIIGLAPASRLELRATTELDPSLTGVSAKAFFGPAERQARVVAAYRIPELLTPEQAVLGGFVSRASLGGSLRPWTGVYLQADAGWNGYGLAGEGTRSEAIFVTGSAEVLLRRLGPALSATYQLDAEYIQRVDLRVTGAPYIPLVDRENHTVQVVASFSLAKVQVTAAGGWTYERFAGSNGPTANVSAAALLGDAWRIEGSAGVSSIARAGVASTQGLFFRLALTRYLGRTS